MRDLHLSYYGDDLTGSTDVMEALASRGLPTVLFVRLPSEAQIRKFPGVRAIGLAGASRSETPAWMEEHLAPALTWLKSLGASFCHYKVCSTFDSSPAIGSIGRAIDIGAKIFDQSAVPLVVGAPQLRRYTAFGNLFAAYQGQVYRIDRHPVMSRHPVTPMDEADLCIHLAAQTNKSIGLLDVVALEGEGVDGRLDAEISRGSEIVLFDVADLASQKTVGRQLLRMGSGRNVFVVGSSGVEYALLSEWERSGVVKGGAPFAPPGPVDRIAVVSGSCSPTTARQIRHAAAHGFDVFEVEPKALASGEPEPFNQAVSRGLDSLSRGRSVILYTALGPETDVGARFEGNGPRHAIGAALGRIQRSLIEQSGVRRAVIAGGDTSSHALRQLDVFALTTALPLPATPGSPLCVAHSDHKVFDGLQIALKGGQVGRDDYFETIRLGVP